MLEHDHQFATAEAFDVFYILINMQLISDL